MTEEQLRVLVREIVAQQLGTRPAPEAPHPSGSGHPSHARFALAGDTAGACLIEPAVRCDRCGFCQSYGH